MNPSIRTRLAAVALVCLTAGSLRAGTISDLACGPGILAQSDGGVAETASLAIGQGETPAEQPMEITIGGGLEFGGVFSQGNSYDVFAGLGFFGLALVERDLAPGRPFPVPAVGTAEVDFFYAPGRNSIADVVYTGRVGFGINLLYMKPGVMFFPYAAVGFGFETLTGTLDLPVGSRSVADTHFILPFEVGAGFTFELKPGTSLFARMNFTFPINAANITGYVRAQFGIAVTL